MQPSNTTHWYLGMIQTTVPILEKEKPSEHSIESR